MHPRHQRGASLLEALIGFIVVTVGLLGTAQWQQRLRQAADLARQQAAALRLAQDEFEDLRATAARGMLPAPTGFDAIADQTRNRAPLTGAHAVQTLSRQVSDRAAPELKQVSVQVDWQDNRGATQSLRMVSTLSGQAPVLAAALAQTSAGVSAAPRLGRHAAIPTTAADLGDGRSAFKPSSDGTEAWLFDRRSGRIVARCGAPADRWSRQLTSSDLQDCTPADALLLSGRVRFSLAGTPGAAPAANDPPRPLNVNLALVSAGHPGSPVCQGEAVTLLAQGGPDRPRTLAVPTGRDADALGLPGWSDTGERWWQFHCTVPRAAAASPGRSSRWSGRLQFSAVGWTLGTVPGAQRLCRYSADTDASGAIDRPAESPDLLSEVDDALTEQNFLVIDGSLPCPAGAPATPPTGTPAWSHANPATVPHPP